MWSPILSGSRGPGQGQSWRSGPAWRPGRASLARAEGLRLLSETGTISGLTPLAAEPDVSDPAPTSPAQFDGGAPAIGAKIAALRRERGWSLQELSRRAGVSPAAIHKIEKKGMTPTITSLMKIAGALGRSVSYIIEEHGALRPVTVVRAGERTTIHTSKAGLRLESIAGRYGPYFMAGAVAAVEPMATSGAAPMDHPGEELMLVIEGTIDWTIEGERHQLGPGDSIHFRTDRPHSWSNPTDEPARALWLTIRSST